ncbi:hypothetical protein Nepgr_031331 [Nepenthes gracilis]|uniref:Uncharacterized protein n=1 Tax=Nepenthes gracilis TaxID=150966 RepID=A0AAD3Y524_NEPGR|nr:hypothetical protein Nepgr_031331 [Nepenthes gracilis]
MKLVIDYDLLSCLSFGLELSLLWSFVEKGCDESDSVTVTSLMCHFCHLKAGLFFLRATVFWPIPYGLMLALFCLDGCLVLACSADPLPENAVAVSALRCAGLKSLSCSMKLPLLQECRWKATGELVAVGLSLEKDYSLDVLISLDVESAAVLLVLHPDACIAGDFKPVALLPCFLKAVVGPCCSLCGRAGTLLSLCSLLNCGEMWCCCLAFNVSLLRLLGALAPAAVLVASAGVLMCISVGCCSILKDLAQPIFFCAVLFLCLSSAAVGVVQRPALGLQGIRCCFLLLVGCADAHCFVEFPLLDVRCCLVLVQMLWDSELKHVLCDACAMPLVYFAVEAEDVFGSRWLNCSESCYGYYLALSLVAACCGDDSLTPASAIDAGQVLLVLLERFPCFSLISWRLLFAAGGVPCVLMTLLAAGADLGDLDVLPQEIRGDLPVGSVLRLTKLFLPSAWCSDDGGLDSGLSWTLCPLLPILIAVAADLLIGWCDLLACCACLNAAAFDAEAHSGRLALLRTVGFREPGCLGYVAHG